MQNTLWSNLQVLGNVAIKTWTLMHNALLSQEHQGEVPSGFPRWPWSRPSSDLEPWICPVLSQMSTGPVAGAAPPFTASLHLYL